jgi:hypothetical protein
MIASLRQLDSCNMRLLTVIMYESDGTHRHIYTDGRPLPPGVRTTIMARVFGRHMDVEMTFNDPEMYTKPFTIQFSEDLWADSDVFEYFCNENEKDRPTRTRIEFTNRIQEAPWKP